MAECDVGELVREHHREAGLVWQARRSGRGQGDGAAMTIESSGDVSSTRAFRRINRDAVRDLQIPPTVSSTSSTSPAGAINPAFDSLSRTLSSAAAPTGAGSAR